MDVLRVKTRNFLARHRHLLCYPSPQVWLCLPECLYRKRKKQNKQHQNTTPIIRLICLQPFNRHILDFRKNTSGLFLLLLHWNWVIQMRKLLNRPNRTVLFPTRMYPSPLLPTFPPQSLHISLNLSSVLTYYHLSFSLSSPSPSPSLVLHWYSAGFGKISQGNLVSYTWNVTLV